MTSSPITRRSALGLAGTAAAALAATTLPTGVAAAAATPRPGAATALRPATATATARHRTPLTNLDHLDFLTDRVAVPATAAHTTYRLEKDPEIGVIWVYADARDGGTYERVGGGAYDAATDTWGQGAYDSDDMTRAAVVYLRHWRATGSAHAREQAYQQLRGVAYFQTLTGPSAGNGVLWMQPDGNFTNEPTPPDDPNPADSGPSYWTARTLWAYGEGYAAFRRSDPRFAAFLAERMLLTVAAIERDVLTRYGRYQVIHGTRVPAWLIVDGADASSEAILGLAAYVRANGPGCGRVASALRKLARGVAEMSAGSTTQWPHRALLPWALSRSDWHAWGAQMASGLAAASLALREKSLLTPAIADAAGFTAQLLTSVGPVNGLLPTPSDRTQIAYGADARIQAALAVGTAAHRPAVRALAGVAAGWFFGANNAGVPVYDPATGVTTDGVALDGTVNHNAGAESTIHGLLAMQVLDAHPDLAALARASADVSTQDGVQVLEAESATLSGDAVTFTPESAWTGESLWSGDAVRLGVGGAITWELPASDQPRLVQPVIAQEHGSRGRARVREAGRTLGDLDFSTGAQGNAPSVQKLIPVALPGTAPDEATQIRITGTRGSGTVDALVVMPEIATLAATGGDRSVRLLTSKATRTRHRRITSTGRATATVADRDGRTTQVLRLRSGTVIVPVLPGGFTLIVW